MLTFFVFQASTTSRLKFRIQRCLAESRADVAGRGLQRVHEGKWHQLHTNRALQVGLEVLPAHLTFFQAADGLTEWITS